jgi:hypothetical protein
MMRQLYRYARLAALGAAVLSASLLLPRHADAMTFSMPAGALAAADTAGGAQTEQVRWCNWRGCWGGYYWRPRVYGYYGVYRPRPYWGWGYRRWW